MLMGTKRWMWIDVIVQLNMNYEMRFNEKRSNRKWKWILERENLTEINKLNPIKKKMTKNETTRNDEIKNEQNGKQ